MPASSSRQAKQLKESVCAETRSLMFIPSVLFFLFFHVVVMGIILHCSPITPSCFLYSIIFKMQHGAGRSSCSHSFRGPPEHDKCEKVQAQTSETPSCNPLLTPQPPPPSFPIGLSSGIQCVQLTVQHGGQLTISLDMSKVLSDCQSLLVEIRELYGAE